MQGIKFEWAAEVYMNDYLDITASELLKELHNFFLIDKYLSKNPKEL